MKAALPLVLVAAAAGGAAAQQQPAPTAAPGASKPGAAVIDVSNPQRSRYPIAVPRATTGDAAAAATIATVAAFDLGVAGWFKVVPEDKIRADLKAEALGMVPTAWKESGAYGVMKYEAQVVGGRVAIDFKLYEVEKGARPVLERRYQGAAADVRKLTHMWCNDVVKHFTGEDGFFGSRLAFVAKGGTAKRPGKKVVTMDFDGHGAASLTRNESINILPAWSPSGGLVAYSSYTRGNPDLYVVSAGGGRATRLSYRAGMNTGATWSPDGSKIALTLTIDGGNPEIYVINASTGARLSRLTTNRAIDTGAAWSPDGREIAFVSDREGGPQVFVMGADGSNPRKVSLNGSYNTSPTWSPVRGKRVLAYTTRADATFDIVTLDLDTGKYTRITQGEGVNEEPSFAPNGRAIAFASQRGAGAGVYIANADGTGDAVQVWKGWSTSIDWGPTPRQ